MHVLKRALSITFLQEYPVFPSLYYKNYHLKAIY